MILNKMLVKRTPTTATEVTSGTMRGNEPLP